MCRPDGVRHRSGGQGAGMHKSGAARFRAALPSRDRIRITHAKAYLFHMGRNAILNRMRDTKERVYFLEWLPETADCENGYEVDHVPSDVLIEIVHEAINSLPPQCREIFMMKRHQKMTYKQIAVVKGISRKTVENQMGIALKKIRSYVLLHMPK